VGTNKESFKMVEIIAITGGKGGTGKSTVATSLAYELSKNNSVLLVDADVDCPNDHLLLNIKREKTRTVFQRIPKFDLEKCNSCGKCGETCKYNAIISINKQKPIFIQEQCNGCGACEIICPEKAISWNKKEIGNLSKGKREKLTLLSGELKASQPVSEFIVNELNIEIEKCENEYDYVIIDTAAGTHCPVIAAFEKAEKIIAVTEPTPLGQHDLKIILRLLKIIKKEGKIVINKSDIGNQDGIKKLAQEFNTEIKFNIPYSKEIVDSYSRGEPVKIGNILELIK
jgi:MinD superfamily P-loop ATPase